ncbi:MAG TPA: hypothetical protein VHG10_07325 [Glycomyces sp.]|nr:hypothetical protein [Glycomyces sp.]
MNPSAAEELPEEFSHSLPEQDPQGHVHAESWLLAEVRPHLGEPAGTGWLLTGILVLVAVGVLMLLIFASGGNADESMML